MEFDDGEEIRSMMILILEAIESKEFIWRRRFCTEVDWFKVSVGSIERNDKLRKME